MRYSPDAPRSVLLNTPVSFVYRGMEVRSAVDLIIKKSQRIALRQIATGLGIEPNHSLDKFNYLTHLPSNSCWNNLSRGMACPPTSIIKCPKFVKNPEIARSTLILIIVSFILLHLSELKNISDRITIPISGKCQPFK